MFMVVSTDGRPYGRLSLSGGPQVVEPQFAYVFDSAEDADAFASHTPDGRVRYTSMAPVIVPEDPVLVDCPTCHYPEARVPGEECGLPCV